MMRLVSWVRTYECPSRPSAIALESLPEEFDQWVAERARSDGTLCFFELEPVVLHAESACPFTRWLLWHRDLGSADVFFWTHSPDCPAALQSVNSWHDFSNAPLSWSGGIEGDASVFEAFDYTMAEALQVAPEAIGDLYKTFFGTVSMTGDNGPGAPTPTGAVADDDTYSTTGLETGESMLLTRNSIAVTSPHETDIRGFAGYMVLAGYASTARMHVGLLTRTITQMASEGSALDRDPWTTLRQAIELQRKSIVVRQAVVGSDFLGDRRLHRVVARAGEIFALRREEIRSFEEVLQSLDRLSTGLLSIGIERSQRRFGLFGLIFAGATLVFAAATGVFDFTESNSAKPWIFAAWAGIAAAFGLTWFATRTRGRPEAR